MRTVLLAAHAMGTRFELVLVGEDPTHLRAAGEEALREIQHWHARLSRFEPDSDIARLNRNPAARIDPELVELLDLCDQLREQTGGAFDPRFAPDRSLDLGAVGKGFALDRAAAILQDCGIENALLHGGTSSVFALGSSPNAKTAKGWPIQLACSGTPLNLTLHNQTLSVSSTRHRAHILNPLTNQPASQADTAAVIAPPSPSAATLADAWSTALIVLGHRPDSLPSHLVSHIHTHTHGWSSSTPRSPTLIAP